ncbi:NAD(P)-binding protein [Suillus fuscotomentosus]|uniref:NAD(P)-binding protein n=1 Tax=Suillus fuscotomentosus TaxID=1912939 RepID=A0AAD4EBF9_9AGAM|nr:NAD(P)-binding protein [Suillus fuscotomentosus]KAG1902897.1 NAD(P)-binding protein [Suillus fuscotomentosus]
MSWPVIVVTGANSGVGLGICQRLLVQLISKSPTDAQPHYNFHVQKSTTSDASFDGLTLILACRSRQRGEAARDKLYQFADEQVRHLEILPGYDGHAETFRKHLNIVVHTVDLSRIQTVFRFADEVIKTYPYVSHLICNAGVASFVSINWFLALKQFTMNWVEAVTAPIFYTQEVGQLSQDGLGWVWQCNVFGHYVLFRSLESHLAKYQMSNGARVIWMSSHESNPIYYDPTDWQLVKTAHSYESSKFQMDLIAHRLDQASLQDSDTLPTRHLIVLPGVAGTNIASALLDTLSSMCMFFAFYLARWLGSPYHLITGFKAAISAVHLCLVPLACLPTVSLTGVEVGFRYVSECDRWGKERVGTMKLTRSKEHNNQCDDLLEHCDRLFTVFCEAEGRPLQS